MINTPLWCLVLLCLCALMNVGHIALAEDQVVDDAQAGAKHVIETVVIEGNTLFSDAVLDPIIAPYRGRALSAGNIQALKDSLTLHYIAQGYLNSGVLIPEQDISTGVVRLRVIEGRLLAVHIDGNQRLREPYIRQRLAPELGNDIAPVLNVNRLQQRLRLLEQDPRIERLHASLKPGLRPGEAELDVSVEEARPYYLSLIVDNHLSPNVGAWQGHLSAGHLNLFGFGDSLALDYRRAQGWESYRLEYAVPLNRHDTVLSLRAGASESEVVVSPFDLLEITSEGETYGVKLRQPLYRTLATEIALGIGFEQRRSDSFLLGDLFDFPESGTDGRSRVNVLSVSQELIHRRINQVWVAQSRFDLARDWLNATRGGEPDALFKAWLGQLQWLRRLEPLDSQLFWRLLIRLTDGPMLSSEQFPLGGYATVRGYRENQLTRDSGWATSLEWRIGLGHVPLPGLASQPGAGRLQLAPFIDYGESWNKGRSTPAPRSLSSVGLGLLWTANRHFSAELYWAEALRTVEPGVEDSLQDDGIHVQIVMRY